MKTNRKKWSYLPRQTTILSLSMLWTPHPPRSLSLFTGLQCLQSLLFCCMPTPSSPRGLHFQSLSCQIILSRPLCGHSFSPFGLGALMPQRGRPHLPYLRGPGTMWSNLNIAKSRKKLSFFAQRLSSILFSQISLSSSFMACLWSMFWFHEVLPT